MGEDWGKLWMRIEVIRRLKDWRWKEEDKKKI